MNQRLTTLGLALLTGAVALVLYGLTLAPGVVSIADDTLEFQMVALRGAIPHPTGYPLYALLLTIGARLLPFGEVAFRANLLSALCAALATGCTFAVGRMVGWKPLAAALGAILFALSPTFWAQATIAEVYALHALLVASLILSILSWGRAQLQRDQSQLPLWTALIFGLGLAHHRTMVLWLPALLLYVGLILRGRREGLSALARPRSLLLMVAAGVAPLLLYAWLPLRAEVGSIDGTYRESGFLSWVTASQYSGFFEDNPLASLRPPSFFAQLTLTELGGAALGLAGVGFVALWRQNRPEWALLASGMVVNAAFAMVYRVPDPEVFWLPVIWVLALLAGGGVHWLWTEMSEVAALRRRNRLIGGLAFALVLAPLAVRWMTLFPLMDRSNVSGPPDFNGRDVLAQPLPENAVIVGLLGEVTYLRYLQEAEGVAPTVRTIDVPTDPISVRVEAVESALAAGERPFLTRELQGAGERWSLSALGPLVEVQATPQMEAPGGLWPVEGALGPAVTLAGWAESPITGAQAVRVTVAWQVEQPITEVLQVSARQIGEDGSVLYQTDEPPLDNAYPTPLWRTGEVILDTYTFPPRPPGAHYLLILYRAADGSEVGRAELRP